MAKRLPDDIKEYFRKQGSMGGKKAAAGMTKKQKTGRARKGGKAKAARRKGGKFTTASRSAAGKCGVFAGGRG